LWLMADDLKARIESVRARIADAAERSGRSPDDVKLVAVSKTHPASVVRAAFDAGLRVFGENKVQEGEEKIEELKELACEWHLIGHLQKNKVRKAVQSFDVIQTVDSVELARRVDRIAGEERNSPLPVLVQIDLAGEERKSGIPAEDAEHLLAWIEKSDNLRLEGLMIIPPFLSDVNQVRPYFRRLREMRDDLKARGSFGTGRGELSMGMSHDFEAAIEEGATIVRVGTAIFGERGRI